jgi:uncharacterized membrane protein
VPCLLTDKIVNVVLETILAKTYKQLNAHGIIGGDLVRPLRLMLIVTSISLICVLCGSLVSALDADEASVSLSWSSQAVYPNDTVSVTITFKSNSAEQLRIYAIGLQFDWMSSDNFTGHDLSDSPVTVPSQGIYIFDPIGIQVPLGTSSGPHSYFVGIDGTEGSSASSFSWNSPSFTIEIHDIIESYYNDVLPMVENNLNEAKSANYASSEAQSLLQQAQVEFDNATSLATQGRWPEAFISLSIADDFLDQAYAAEQSGGGQQIGPQSLLFYLAIIAIVVIIVIAIIFVVVRRRRRQTESGAEQPVETIEEQSEEQS